MGRTVTCWHNGGISYEGTYFTILGCLGLENMGVFTAHGSENGSAGKLDELKKFGASL